MSDLSRPKLKIQSLKELKILNKHFATYTDIYLYDWALPYVFEEIIPKGKYKHFKEMYIEMIKFSVQYADNNNGVDIWCRGQAVDRLNKNLVYTLDRCSYPGKDKFNKYMKKMMKEIMVIDINIPRFNPKTW